MPSFLINTFYYNEVAWYEVTTTDYKSYSLSLHTFNPDGIPPPSQLFLYQSQGAWCCNVKVAQTFVDRLGSACVDGLREWEKTNKN